MRTRLAEALDGIVAGGAKGVPGLQNSDTPRSLGLPVGVTRGSAAGR